MPMGDTPRPGDVSERIAAIVRDRGEVDLTELVDGVEADAGRVYRCVRRLERDGRIRSIGAGIYRPAEEDPSTNRTDREEGDGDRPA